MKCHIETERTLIRLSSSNEWKGTRQMREHIRVGAALLGLALVIASDVVPSQYDDRLIILRFSASAKGTERRGELGAECFG